MRFPESVTVVAREKKTRIPVKDVAIVLVLFAERKNNYSVGPLITDQAGEVVFTRTECEAAIKQAQEAFVMDYWGDLESCRPVISARLQASEHIDKMLENYKSSPEFWGKGFPKQLFRDLQNVSNADYEGAQITVSEEQILANPQLELLLAKKAM